MAHLSDNLANNRDACLKALQSYKREKYYNELPAAKLTILAHVCEYHYVEYVDADQYTKALSMLDYAILFREYAIRKSIHDQAGHETRMKLLEEEYDNLASYLEADLEAEEPLPRYKFYFYEITYDFDDHRRRLRNDRHSRPQAVSTWLCREVGRPDVISTPDRPALYVPPSLRMHA